MSNEQYSIAVAARTASGTSVSRRMRRSGQVPAVVYGHGGEATMLTMEALDAADAVHHTGLFQLDGLDKPVSAILKDTQWNAITGAIMHIDFQEVRADEEIHTSVAIEAVGEAAGLSAGGQLEQVMHEIEVYCLPTDLPEVLKVDVSAMKLDDIMHVREMVLPAGISVHTDADLPVFQVRTAKSEEDVAPAAEEAPAEEAASE